MGREESYEVRDVCLITLRLSVVFITFTPRPGSVAELMSHTTKFVLLGYRPLNYGP